MAEREAPADVIVSGRDPRRPPPRPGGLHWLLVLAETVALVIAVTVAVRFHAESQLRRGALPAASPATPPPMPGLTAVALALPADGTVRVTVLITAAAEPGAGLAQFTVSAIITGGLPDTVYDLDGNDCSTPTPLTNHVWATGSTGADGTADLVGYAWTGAVADRFWLTLDPSPVNPPPGLHGQFAAGQAAPFPAGQAPCAPDAPHRA